MCLVYSPIEVLLNLWFYLIFVFLLIILVSLNNKFVVSNKPYCQAPIESAEDQARAFAISGDSGERTSATLGAAQVCQPHRIFLTCSFFQRIFRVLIVLELFDTAV